MWLAKNLLKSNLSIFGNSSQDKLIQRRSRLLQGFLHLNAFQTMQSDLMLIIPMVIRRLWGYLRKWCRWKNDCGSDCASSQLSTRRLYNVARFTGCAARHLVTCGGFIYGTFAFLMCVIEECDIFVRAKCRGTGIVCTCSGNKEKRSYTQQNNTHN